MRSTCTTMDQAITWSEHAAVIAVAADRIASAAARRRVTKPPCAMRGNRPSAASRSAQNTAPQATVSADDGAGDAPVVASVRRPGDHADDRHQDERQHAEQAIDGDRRERLACRVGVSPRQAVGARRVGADAGRQEAADERADQEQARGVARS